METSAIHTPCSEIQKTIDKMIAETKIEPDEFAKAVVHMPNCQQCLDYMSSKLNSEKK
jgi:3-hydroxy-3-methylglutaryl CoA synthase